MSSSDAMMQCCVCGILLKDPSQQWRDCQCPAHLSYMLTSAGACLDHMCTILQVPWCFHCMQLDPTGFRQELSLQADTELGFARSIALPPAGELGARCRSSIVYCQEHGAVSRGVALDWTQQYLLSEHHLTPATISAVVQHLIDTKGWKTYHFVDAMTPASADRLTLDRTVERFRTYQDVQIQDYTRLCARMIDHAVTLCETMLPEDQRAHVMDMILTAVAAEEPMCEAAIDSLIHHALAHARSGAVDM